MTSSRPYLIRALYEWIVDNGLTPYLLIDATQEGLDAPLEYADKGKLVLNVAPRAVRALNLGNSAIDFNARFGGAARDVHLPVQAVLAVYARENGQGMLFSEEPDGDEPPSGPGGSNAGAGNGRKKPHLRVIK
ncbi:ClpXP protease specificity-enhancing factor [Nitrococcus mobilis]|uniref:Stringent starvation protein B n=1 Tax=Nitrococcus mobilis Nb-231 TaxID=314278 RepID=A4BQK0_9GAMM|nr:ClpXP protease specificity-enhancing factor [Nitrococcus mobilis]EAR21850.1 Stringent starvation protein B [Nitrococcus mobilis Nb-231]